MKSSSSRTMDTRRLNPLFFAAQIQIPIPSKYLGFGYKGVVFCGNNGKGTHSTKIGAYKMAKNTPNAPKFIGPNCLPKPKSLVFRWKKAFHWASVVRVPVDLKLLKHSIWEISSNFCGLLRTLSKSVYLVKFTKFSLLALKFW